MPATSARVALLVIYTERMVECVTFYRSLGLGFAVEQHRHGPLHHAAVLADGTVFEIYPASERRPTSTLRLGFAVAGPAVQPPLGPGRHVLTDPDGRKVEVYAA
ncbi:VOC family protein [Marinitenerispora sediminis]|uniref:Glyoxalase/bleomycin resistance/dioxygenase family protein n=1 Tax=Marinitenerispora sediminis TaxID=1931232 RepID=A0A368T484_9ACTN|nr:glyoxalase/bleomycin resistance/dioxygenase family protein [Marinitenerispora sediminis]RCV54895.1 glyoxalase/bleomycin resistance/dioxygenase family protein [Marinitenerispora sediminis]RCV57412.1 glyoxalase/bleomycin resistance/dioxygenase family protein [Marinitenerispora sediminis]RCV60290.1 glyoxalase/bleomycin resistance/dioxygenase family protein [Marinitenerispora sediminis]